MNRIMNIKLIGLSLLAALALAACGKEGSDPVQETSKIPVHKTVTVEEFLKLPTSDTYYNLKGTVESVLDAHYSQFVLADKTGKVSVFGLWSGEGGARVYDMAGLKVGDAVSIAALHNEYKGEVEARSAYLYNPADVKMWIETITFNAPSAATSLSTTMYALDQVSISSEVDWLSAAYDEKGEILSIEVAANSNLDIRVGYVTVSCGNQSQRIRVTQEAYEPEVEAISSALGKSFARVKGKIGAMGSDGYVIYDETAAIFVHTESFLGLDLGITMDVSGNISTANYLTSIEPDVASKAGKGKVEYNAALFTVSDSKALKASLSGQSATAPRTLDLKCVEVRGMLSSENEVFVLRDFDTDEIITLLDNSNYVDLTEFVAKYVSVKGYLATLSDGEFLMIGGPVEEVKVESAVTIDGNFSDWAAIQGYTQDVDGNPLVETKFYTAGTNIYMYFKAKEEAFTEIGSYKYFAQVYFNADNDESTGPYAWVFYGLDTCSYLYMFNSTGFNTDGSGSILNNFQGGDGKPFISANASLFEGTFTGSGGETFPCGGRIQDGYCEFEWVIGLGPLGLQRHSNIGCGIRLCHEGPNTPSGEQENFFIPSNGWFPFTIK